MASSFNFKESKVFKLAFELAMEIFEISKAFPKEEKYSLTDQIRRSSRSVCANLAEANRKRIYPAHFVSKPVIQILKTAKHKFGCSLLLNASI